MTGRAWAPRVALAAAVVGMGACGLLGGDGGRPTADEGEVTRILGGGETPLADGVGARAADLDDVFGFGVGADGTVALSAEADGLDGQNGVWVLDPDATTVRALGPDEEGADFSFSPGDPLVRSATVLVPTIYIQALAEEIPLDDPVERTPVAPADEDVPDAEQVFGSLAEADDGAVWRTYRTPPTVRRVAGDDVTTVDLGAEGCRDATPLGLAALDEGALVADPGCRALWAVGSDGRVSEWVDLPSCPDGVRGAMAPTDVARHRDTLLVADTGCRMVWVAPVAGGPLEPLLGGGRGGGGGDTIAVEDLSFDAPVGVEVDDEGRVYVLDGVGFGFTGRAVADSPVLWMTGPGLV